MLKIENVDIYGWEAAIRGMRNPMNSWDKSDSFYCGDVESECRECSYNKENGLPCLVGNTFVIGKNDLKLMNSLAAAGSDHGKFLRMINVTLDITAPLYWWKEFDTYKVGTVANSCSTMHKIADKDFTLEDFSCEHLESYWLNNLKETIRLLNDARDAWNWCGTDDKKEWWWQMIQLLPSSYNQRRTVQLNYAVLRNIFPARKNHKLDEWHTFCKWIETLPYSELITGEGGD